LKRRRPRRLAVIAGALVAALALLPLEAGAHAFVSRTDPRASATLGEPPALVRIWFDGPVETMFLKLRVENEHQQRVDKGDARLNPTTTRRSRSACRSFRPDAIACSGAWWPATDIGGKGASPSS
jgi:methionine-rich copper-binding protein CopC